MTICKGHKSQNICGYGLYRRGFAFEKMAVLQLTFFYKKCLNIYFYIELNEFLLNQPGFDDEIMNRCVNSSLGYSKDQAEILTQQY